MAKIDIDRKWLRRAYEVASEKSTDPSTQNGAILVQWSEVNPEGREICEGANHFPIRVEEKPERWERPTKYSYVEHAERNVIYKAARLGYRVSGATMYVPWFACSDCARAIIQAGVYEVVGHKDMYDKGGDRWKESIRIALEMLTESGVRQRMIEGPLDLPFELRFDGNLWRP